MAENSPIEWTDHTFNPWMGCQKVSDGCKHCYAETLMDHRYGKVQWGPTGRRVRTSPSNWKKPLKWNNTAICGRCGYAENRGSDDCRNCGREFSQKRKPRVFCASLADIFEDKPDQREEMDKWRQDLFSLIESTPWLDWLLLTKRPENIARMMPERWGADNARRVFDDTTLMPANVWVGVSVENQEQAERRVPYLLEVPAVVRFLSCEPLLGPVDLFNADGDGLRGGLKGALHWVICGGESGKDARPMNPLWALALRDQCVEAGVPFLFKQWGEYAPWGSHNVSWAGNEGKKETDWGLRDWHMDDGQIITGKFRHHPYSNDNYMAVVAVGKKRAGRLLDGRTWDQFPTTEKLIQ